MSEFQAAMTEEERTETPRPSTSKEPATAEAPRRNADRDEAAPRRRLLSLAAQKRRLERPPAPKPHLDDPMARAMELLSGIDEHVRAAEAGPSRGEEPAKETAAAVEGDTPTSPPANAAEADFEERLRGMGTGTPETQENSEAPVDAVSTWEAFAPSGSDASAPDATPPEPGEERRSRRLEDLRLEDLAAIGRDAGPVASLEDSGAETYQQVVRTEDASPVVAKETKRSPARALYSLQEVHERTGIPYATLALYAASHAAEIPSLGERRSPAYPREGLEAFHRIHAEKHPGWTPPEAGTEEGWDDESGLSRRLDALTDGLDALRSDVEEIERVVRRGWTAEVYLFD